MIKIKDKLINLIYSYARGQMTLRERLFLFAGITLAAILAVTAIVLNVANVVPSKQANIARYLNQQMVASQHQQKQYFNNLAIYTVDVSKRISEHIDEFLTRKGMRFEDLDNNPDALTDLQKEIIEENINDTRFIPASGVFYMLNASVNTHLPEKHMNSVYLKYGYLYSSNNFNNTLTMFRGFPEAAKENGLALHSSWQLETLRSAFPDSNKLTSQPLTDLNTAYTLSTVYALNNTWDQVRLFCIPLFSRDGKNMGITGFEISTNYYQLLNRAAPTGQYSDYKALFSKQSDGYAGQVVGYNNDCNMSESNLYTISEPDGYELRTISNGERTYRGIIEPIKIGNSTHYLANMITEEEYQKALLNSNIKIILIDILLIALAIAACYYLTNYYLSPVLKALHQMHENKPLEVNGNRIAEIQMLSDYLTHKSKEEKERLQQIEEKHQQAEANYHSAEATLTRIRNEYEKIKQELDQAQAEYERSQADYAASQQAYAEVQDEYAKAQEEFKKAQTKIKSMTDKKKQEFTPEQLEFFAEALETLTAKERAIYDMHLQGLSGKQIQEEQGITENTLKYHNKNLYSKLGVSSRKELVTMAAILEKHPQKP